jgi:hypothetical protein
LKEIKTYVSLRERGRKRKDLERKERRNTIVNRKRK